VTAMEERYALNKTDQAEMAKRVKNNQAEEKSAKPAKAKKAKAAPAAEGADDLSKISGVGPVIVGKLNGEGITTFAQIAAWTDADVEAIEEKLSFKGRVGREDWIAQAKELAKG